MMRQIYAYKDHNNVKGSIWSKVEKVIKSLSYIQQLKAKHY